MKKNIQALFDKLAAAEQDFLKREFLSPVLRGNSIRVRIAGVILNLYIQPRNFQGWGVFRPTSNTSATHIRPPSMAEKDQYLHLFPKLRLILTRRMGEQWFAIPASLSDTRFRIQGSVPVMLPEEVQVFDTVEARFDGNHLWFDKIDQSRDPKIANYLRENLVLLTEPEKIHILGITAEERDAYLMAYGPALAADIESKRDKNEDRIKEALHHAGAAYRSYRERDDTYTIEYSVDGEGHTSVLNKKDLSVQVAGICLSGGDKLFDLQSLVGVIREGRRRHNIVRVGINARDQEWYERVHPPNQYDGDDDEPNDPDDW